MENVNFSVEKQTGTNYRVVDDVGSFDHKRHHNRSATFVVVTNEGARARTSCPPPSIINGHCNYTADRLSSSFLPDAVRAHVFINTRAHVFAYIWNKYVHIYIYDWPSKIEQTRTIFRVIRIVADSAWRNECVETLIAFIREGNRYVIVNCDRGGEGRDACCKGNSRKRRL